MISSSETQLENERASSQLAFEIAWCLEKLEEMLQKGKHGEKKLKEMKKAVRLLKNKDTPLVQQRQLMRVHCGDYREKIKAEEEAVRLDANKVKFHDVSIKT